MHIGLPIFVCPHDLTREMLGCHGYFRCLHFLRHHVYCGCLGYHGYLGYVGYQ